MKLGEFREKTKSLPDDTIIFVEYDCSYYVLGEGNIFAGVVLDGNVEYNTGKENPYPIFRFLHTQPENTKITAISLG